MSLPVTGYISINGVLIRSYYDDDVDYLDVHV